MAYTEHQHAHAIPVHQHLKSKLWLFSLSLRCVYDACCIPGSQSIVAGHSTCRLALHCVTNGNRFQIALMFWSPMDHQKVNCLWYSPSDCSVLGKWEWWLLATELDVAIGWNVILVESGGWVIFWGSDGTIWPWGKRFIWYDMIVLHKTLRYDMIWPQNALPYLTTVCCYLHCIHK